MNSVLIFSGLDPSAGAGIVADIEVVNYFKLTPLSIVTNLTVQNTASIKTLNEVDTNIIQEQFYHLQKDIDFQVVKIGILSSAKQIKAIANLVKDKTIVLDPIVKSSSGDEFLNTNLVQSLKRELLPIVKIITPNVFELQALSGEIDEQKGINKLNIKWVLLTKTDTSQENIQHCLYRFGKLYKTFDYKKLSHNYHGSGCTLSTSIAALLALGYKTSDACTRALDYTYQTLLSAKSIGKIALHPNRVNPL